MLIYPWCFMLNGLFPILIELIWLNHTRILSCDHGCSIESWMWKINHWLRERLMIFSITSLVLTVYCHFRGLRLWYELLIMTFYISGFGLNFIVTNCSLWIFLSVFRVVGKVSELSDWISNILTMFFIILNTVWFLFTLGMEFNSWSTNFLFERIGSFLINCILITFFTCRS